VRRERRVRLAGAVAAVALLAAACAGSDGSADGTTPTTSTTTTATAPAAPGDATSTPAAPVEGPGAGGMGAGATEWETVEPDAVGLDGAVLDDLAARAEANESSCLLVVRHGRIAGEWYFGGGAADRAEEVFSATKSFTSILVGIAQDRGLLDLDDPAATQIEAWQGTDAEAVTVRNLLSNDSGRSWSLVQDYTELIGQEDKTGFAIGLGQDHEPGTTWAYNNAAIQTLDRVISEATDQPTAEFGRTALLDPIGMADSHVSTDQHDQALTFMGLKSTCRDLGRFGQLLLRDGAWDGEQVVSADYVEEATTSSQPLNEAYGFLIWLNVRGNLASAVSPVDGSMDEERPEAQLVEGAPEDLFWALGLGGQIVQVDRDTDTVVVRLGSASLAPTFGNADTARVVTDAITD